MGFISKIKNILFEEEVIEEPVKEEVKEKFTVKEPEPKKRVFDLENDFPIVEEPKMEELKRESFSLEEDSERDLFKSERTFNFPLFDEEEFESTLPKMRSTNVLAKEKPVKKPEKRIEYPRYEKIERSEEKRKFKPSPIISPVYGILDKDYSKEDIVPKKKDDDILRRRDLSIESVRKKAFGDLEDEIEKTITKPRDEFFETVKEELEEIREPESKKEEKIDIEDLLKDSAHEEIIIPEEDFASNIDDIELELEKLDEEDDILEQLDKSEKVIDEDDTLEQDLFELIDSMYDDRKEDVE